MPFATGESMKCLSREVITLSSGLAHHAEPGNPVLLSWLRDQIDAVVGLDPVTIVMLLAVVIVLMPVGIMVLFLVQRKRQGRI